MQWPGLDWCPTEYDPRFRSWYVSAASGPKDVVIVIDTSGSMSQRNRMSIAATAALRLLGTFTDVDHVAMVQFNSDASSALGRTTLQPATKSELDALRGWVRGLNPGGSTNYYSYDAGQPGGLNVALDLLEASSGSASSGCSKAILFLSDGVPTVGEVSLRGSAGVQISERSEALGVSIFT